MDDLRGVVLGEFPSQPGDVDLNLLAVKNSVGAGSDPRRGRLLGLEPEPEPEMVKASVDVVFPRGTPR